MTICVAIAVFDGIVFAADSASSLIGYGPSGIPEITNVYKNGNKVFNLIKGLPIVAMTCGLGNIGRAPIASITKNLRKLMSDDSSEYYIDKNHYSVREIADKARKYIFEECFNGVTPKIPEPNSLEYWVGGFSSHSDLHEVWKIVIINGACGDPIRLADPGELVLAWAGQPEAINRLVIGFSPSIERALNHAGMDPSVIAAVLPRIQQVTEAPILSAAMPMQDAIELADFLVDLTKRFVRFLPGADTVGGDTDIAAVTRHERFKWIKRKHYYPATLNPMETDHV